MLGCVVHRDIKDLGREPSCSRPYLEYHKLRACKTLPTKMGYFSNTNCGIVVSAVRIITLTLIAGRSQVPVLGNIHGFVLD